MIRFKKFLVVLILVAMVGTSLVILTGCVKDDITTSLDNETDRLVLSIGELDGVFNPFFSTSATDGTIIGMTQIGMLSSDKDGNVAYGTNEPCVVLDYGQKTEGDTVHPTVDNSTTTYTFVLKNDLKFSDGSPLTMKDVLFNLYVYLDPAYTGSSTVYSTEIDGLAEYRTQTSNPNEQEEFQATYEQLAGDRVYNLADLLEDIYKDFQTAGQAPTDDGIIDKLEEEQDYYQSVIDDPTSSNADKENAKQWLTLVADYNRAKELFMKELESDYTLSVGTAEEIKFDEDRVSLSTDAEAFLYNEGLIYWDDSDSQNPHLVYSLGTDSKYFTREQAIDAVYRAFVPGTASKGMIQVLTTTQTTSTLIAEFTAKAMKEYFDSIEVGKIPNVSGIEFANKDGPVEFENVNGDTKTYDKPTYNSDGSVKDGYEVLQIKIKGIDPKAIWNFAFTVAPMYYYSSPEEISLFNYTDHFGVSFGDIEFMNNYVRDPDKIGLPVGAGPYKATTVNGKGTVTPDTFKENNVVHFERNEHFMFPVNIKYVNYQVVDAKMMLESLFNGDIHFAEPNCKQENIDQVNAKKDKGFTYKKVMTNGYGYIGINAEKVPSHFVRQAIMHAIDVSLCTAYYAGNSYNIYRPMTRASWAYPVETDESGPYYEYDDTGKTSEDLVVQAGFTAWKDKSHTLRMNPVTGETLEYTFTIAGDSEDHPAFNAMTNAKEILNKIGFKITVQKDINALKKLNTGDLTVWAAAWGSGVDPDMYQVYHIDSQATSTANWGYRAIRLNRNGKYDYELGIVNNLSDIIDKARQTLDQDERTAFYATALDLVMKLAVELPTYQRSDMFAYNSKVIDESTLTPEDDLTPFNGPLNRLWEVSFVVNK